MSSDEAFKLCSILASLNYKGQRIHITPDLFQKPNINLVYDILNWCLNILDDKRNVEYLRDEQAAVRLSDLDEAQRVSCLISVARLVSIQLGIKLDLVALYCANITCCPELLKIVEPIYESAKLAVDKKKKINNLNVQRFEREDNNNNNNKENLVGDPQIMMTQVLELINQKGKIKELSDEVSLIAQDLDSLIGNEEKFNEERLRVMDRQLELAEIERVLHDAHEDIVVKTNELAKSNEELDSDLIRLDERLKSKELELDKVKDRLKDLLFQSPAYVERYEKLHEKYENAYANYVSKYRNLMYLKSCVYSEDTSHDDDDDENVGETTGPARLLESLLEGNSKPISASCAEVDATGEGVEKEAELAIRGEKAGLDRIVGLRDVKVERKDDEDAMDTGDALGLGLELEGLLNEFVGETSGMGKVKSGNDDEDDDDEPDEYTDDGSSDEDDDDDDGANLDRGGYRG